MTESITLVIVRLISSVTPARAMNTRSGPKGER